MIACNDTLVTAFSNDLISLSGTLLATRFIPPEIQDKMHVSANPNNLKASELVEAVRKTIQITPKSFLWFYKTEKGMPIQEVANILSLKYIELSNARIAVVKAAAKAHVKKERITNSALLLLATYTSAMALAMIVSIQNVVVTVFIGIMTMSILLAILDAIGKNKPIVDAMMDHFHLIALLLGKTFGNFIPFPCPNCRTWSRVSRYGPGTIVKPPIICPSCHRDIFNGQLHKMD